MFFFRNPIPEEETQGFKPIHRTVPGTAMHNCRLCARPGEQDETLLFPCDCDEPIHPRCLEQWRRTHANQRAFWVCEECDTPYAVAPPRLDARSCCASYCFNKHHHGVALMIATGCFVVVAATELCLGKSWRVQLHWLPMALIVWLITDLNLVAMLLPYMGRRRLTFGRLAHMLFFAFIAMLLLCLAVLTLSVSITGAIYLTFLIEYGFVAILLISMDMNAVQVAPFPQEYHRGNDVVIEL